MSPFLAHLTKMPYHGAIRESFALADLFRYTTVQLLLPSRRVLMEKRCHDVVIECLLLRLMGRLLSRTSEKNSATGEVRQRVSVNVTHIA